MANTPTAASAALLSPVSAGEAALLRHSRDRFPRAELLGTAGMQPGVFLAKLPSSCSPRQPV